MEKNWIEIREDITSLDTKINDDFESSLDKYHYHEALDRTFLAGQMVEQMLVDHPVYKENKSLNDKLSKVLELLAEMYQDIPNLPNYI